jgi:hypothetical protein
MCNVAITSAVGILSSGVLQAIIVKGTSSDCDLVQVKIFCQTTSSDDEATFEPDMSGDWYITFNSIDIAKAGCLCDQNIKILAHCANVPNCSDTKALSLECVDCPTVTLSMVPDPPCVNNNQQRHVTFLINNSGPATPSAHLNFGDFSFIDLPQLAVGLNIAQHFYGVPGMYNVTLHVSGCDIVTLTINLDACAPQPQCPNMNWTVNQGDCLPNNTRPVKIKIDIPLPLNLNVTYALKEGANILIPATNVQLPATVTYEGDFLPGIYDFTLDIMVPEGCGDSTWSDYEVLSCDPPVTGACCLPNNTCIQVTEADCELNNGTYMGDGTICDNITCGPPEQRTGACCLPDGSCQEMTPAECGAKGGTYQGDDTLCANVKCPPPKENGDGCGCPVCVILGLLLAILTLYSLVLIVVGDPIAGPLTAMALLVYSIAFIKICGWCSWAVWTIVGVVLFIIALIIMALLMPLTLALVIAALVAAVALLVTAIVIVQKDC